MMTLELPAPAKLNLFLHILGRRHDGYHELQTLFQFLDWGDRLRFTATDDSQITLSSPLAGVPDEQNLIIKAAKRLLPFRQGPQGAIIELDKQLPMGGGIGGGSSDAATTLVGLNRLWQCGLTEDQLAEIGLDLGADVPVFVRGRAAFAEGVGERLRPIEPEEPWYLVVIPNTSISTAEVFGHPELTRNTPAITMAHVLTSDSHNDCEAVVRSLYPELEEIFKRLKEFGQPRLTGTGACIFCAFPSREHALRAQAQLPNDWQTQLCRGCNQSALQPALEQQFNVIGRT